MLTALLPDISVIIQLIPISDYASNADVNPMSVPTDDFHWTYLPLQAY